jgi:hypothetical protein
MTSRSKLDIIQSMIQAGASYGSDSTFYVSP